MSTRFLPTQESVLNSWLANFGTKISASPGTYGLKPADAASIAAAVAAWKTAYETASSPATRTRGAVAAKRGEKKSVVALVRGFAGMIRSDDAVSSELKIGLGLKLRARRGSPTPTPTSAPALALHRMATGVHELRALRSGESLSSAKPHGVASLMVYRAVGEHVVTRAEEAQFLTLVTRTRFMSTFDHAQRGQTATYFARWINTKGEPGPWSVAMSAAIAA
jgi:hypothetical protein